MRLPDCPPNCGGCFFKTQTYEEELVFKQELLREWFEPFSFIPKILPSPHRFGYRTRMDFLCFNNKIGLRKQGVYNSIVDLDKCLILNDRMNNTFSKARELLLKYKKYFYDIDSHKGIIRYLTIRGFDQVMVSITLASEELISDLKRDFSVLIKDKIVDSVYFLLNNSWSDVAFGSEIDFIGKEYITIDYGNPNYNNPDGDHNNYKFIIKPNVFFQSNYFVAKLCYDFIRENVDEGSDVLELYSGTSTIGIFISKKARSVRGVENNKENIRVALDNIRLNKVNNVKVVDSDVKVFLRKPFKEDTLIVDPPRSGLGKNIIRKILWRKPNKIIYMSCNPKTMIKDLKQLLKKYDVVNHKTFDMFPRTRHLEVIVVLEKKHS